MIYESTYVDKNKYDEFVQLCETHNIDKLYAFGSSITEHFDEEKSDIDIVLSLNITDPVEYGETLLSIWDNLEKLFNKKVDLLTEESIKNPYLKKSIDATKKLIYDRQGKKVFI